MSEQKTHLRVSSPDDLLALVPYWLGYQPSDCVVLLVESDNRIQSGCALSLEQCADDDILASMVDVLGPTTSRTSYLLVAYGAPEHAEPALRRVRRALKGRKLLETAIVDSGRYWLCSRSERIGIDPGHVLNASASPLTAAAVQAGLQVFGSREDLAAMVEGPEDSDDEATFLWTEACRRVSRWGPKRRNRLVDETLGDAVDGLRQPDALVCAQLGAAVQSIATRDHAWLAMTLEDGWRHQQLWLWVVAVTPAPFCAPVLCLAAVASWLSGGGALFTECVNRCEQLHPDYSMLNIVRELHDCAIPPSTWRELGASLREMEVGRRAVPAPAPRL